MMLRKICLCLLLITAFSNAAENQHKLLLSLKYHQNSEVINEVNFYGTKIDPNVISNEEEQFKITVNGIEVDFLNDATYWRLHKLRRSFSYDTFSQGIEKLDVHMSRCRLGGPARGLLLEARYLTYENNRIVQDEMRPIYDVPLNCLYRPEYQPVSHHAREAVRGVIETLRTIEETFSGNQPQIITCDDYF
nr:hypothetical protein [Endozoicomonas sp.]